MFAKKLSLYFDCQLFCLAYWNSKSSFSYITYLVSELHFYFVVFINLERERDQAAELGKVIPIKSNLLLFSHIILDNHLQDIQIC